MSNDQSPQEYFRLILLNVVGQAFAAAGYALEEREVQWAGGLFRFAKAFDDGLRNPAIPSTHPAYARRTLSALVMDDFNVHLLPSNDYWWTFSDLTELGKGLMESGYLLVGYGLPWLSGDLPTNH